MTTKLTEHFTLEEFTASQTASRMGLNNVPPEGSQERANVQRTAETLEKVRLILGEKPVLISSGYRSPEVNRAVGGATNSAHLSGLAVDFTCPGYGTPLDVCHALQPHMADLGIDQLIYEYASWVHLGLSAGEPRHMALTIDNGGTRTGIA
jgi:hypothetical protein